MDIYSKTDSQVQETNQWSPVGRWNQGGLVGVWDEETQTIMYKVDKQQDVLYSTGNYCLVIAIDITS